MTGLTARLQQEQLASAVVPVREQGYYSRENLVNKCMVQ